MPWNQTKQPIQSRDNFLLRINTLEKGMEIIIFQTNG